MKEKVSRAWNHICCIIDTLLPLLIFDAIRSVPLHLFAFPVATDLLLTPTRKKLLYTERSFQPLLHINLPAVRYQHIAPSKDKILFLPTTITLHTRWIR